MITSPCPALVGNIQLMNLTMLSNTPRPSSTAASMLAKLSSVRIMAAASFETSVPVMPMATPISARLSAGASFTPSPVMATTSPRACSACTRRSFCSGVTRANTAVSAAAASNAASSSASSWRPLSARGGRSRLALGSSPISAAMAAAVTAWSPVIIFTRMPAVWQACTARTASARGGSIMPCRPRNSNPPPTSPWPMRARPAPLRRAKASTRRPSRAMASTSACTASASSGWLAPSAPMAQSQRASTASTAPFR